MGEPPRLNRTNDSLIFVKKAMSAPLVPAVSLRLCKGSRVAGEAGYGCLGFKSAESHYHSGT